MSITEHLVRADYYIFIDFKRDYPVPISVSTHQEFALARAWRITEMLAFKEAGLTAYGMLSYVLAHPTEFERRTLVTQVRDEMVKRGWNADHSRNLVADHIEFLSQTLAYGNHQAANIERICRIIIENRRSDQAALATIAILDSVDSNGSITKPDRTYLKWAGQQAYQKTIFPQDHGEIDAFAIRADESGVFLHGANDLYPRRPIITNAGSCDLRYMLYARGFPPTYVTVTLDYQGLEGSTASLKA
jgi:hypothetical protein